MFILTLLKWSNLLKIIINLKAALTAFLLPQITEHTFHKRSAYCMAYFRKRGEKWSFTIDIGPDPVTGKRRQKTVR